MINERPLSDRVIIKPDQPEESQFSTDDKPSTGEVVAVGRGKIGNNDQPIPVEPKVGERVRYGKFSGQEIIIDGEDYLIMRETELMSIL